MQEFRARVHFWLTDLSKTVATVQAGTPMTVTGNGTSSGAPGRGVMSFDLPRVIFCSKISPGGSGGRQPPAVVASAGIRR